MKETDINKWTTLTIDKIIKSYPTLPSGTTFMSVILNPVSR